jgi:TatD DNase family protein
MIDFHCHLDLYPDPSDVIRGCITWKMYVLSVTTTPSAWAGTSALVRGSNHIRTALGLHPQLAHERKCELALFDRLLPETRYVGEVGLDGSPELSAHWQDQVLVFEHILSSCQNQGGRIISIHSRRAVPAVLERLESHPRAGVPILHWYSGSNRDLQKAISLGCWFSIGPLMMLSKKGIGLVAHIPPDRILTETDGPFVFFDGRQTMPWDVEAAISKLAELWDIQFEAAQQRLQNNLQNLLTDRP